MPCNSGHAWLALLVCSIAVSMQLRAQQNVVVSNAPCGGCTVTLHPVVTLGSESDSALPSPIGRLARDSRGRFFVAGYNRTSILVYDSYGRLTGTFGRGGEGPGELGGITRIQATFGDSLIVQHRGVALFTPSFTFARAIDRPELTSAGVLPLSDGRYLFISTTPADPRSTLRAFAVSSGEPGEYSRFGPPARRDPACSRCAPVVAAHHDANNFWSYYEDRYTLQIWRADGALLSTVQVAAPWFDTTKTEFRSTPQHPPATRLLGISHISATTIAVFGVRAAESWRPSVAAASMRIGGVAGVAVTGQLEALVHDFEKVHDTFVDVIDISRGTLLARGHFSEQTLLPLGGNLAYTQHVDSLGVAQFQIWRLAINQR